MRFSKNGDARILTFAALCAMLFGAGWASSKALAQAVGSVPHVAGAPRPHLSAPVDSSGRLHPPPPGWGPP